MKTRYKIIMGLFLFFSLLANQADSGEILTASGCSVSKVGYLSSLVKDYEKETGVKILLRAGGSVIGINDLRDGKVDFAASCRKKLPDDPKDVEFIEVARDVLVFIVHKTNPVDNISIDDVRAIYAGKITNWKQLKDGDAPIKTFIAKPRKSFSGVESSTIEMVLDGKEPVNSSNIISLSSTGIVEQMVERAAEAFATTGFTSARKRNVKMLKVNGVMPTKENIVSQKYPLNRPLFLVVHQKAKPGVQKFIDFVLSKKGQKFISSYGAVSLSDMR